MNGFQECSALSHSQLLNIHIVWTADPSLFLHLFPAYFDFSTLDRTTWSGLKPETLLPLLLLCPILALLTRSLLFWGTSVWTRTVLASICPETDLKLAKSEQERKEISCPYPKD